MSAATIQHIGHPGCATGTCLCAALAGWAEAKRQRAEASSERVTLTIEELAALLSSAAWSACSLGRAWDPDRSAHLMALLEGKLARGLDAGPCHTLADYLASYREHNRARETWERWARLVMATPVEPSSRSSARSIELAGDPGDGAQIAAAILDDAPTPATSDGANRRARAQRLLDSPPGRAMSRETLLRLVELAGEPGMVRAVEDEIEHRRACGEDDEDDSDGVSS